MDRFKLNFGTMLRATGVVLVIKGALCWMAQIGIMYAYAERGIVDNYSTVFLLADIFFTGSIILGIYFSELGTIKAKKSERKRAITLRKDIPTRRAGIFLFFEIIGSILIFLTIPEFPRLWIFIVIEFITCVWAMGRAVGED